MISILGSEIGRGHPFYLDGFRRALHEAGAAHLIERESDVFRVSRGVSRAAWEAVRRSYQVAGAGGPISHAYHRLRRDSNYDRDSFLLSVLGRDLRRWAGSSGVVVVDHPAVAGALGDRADTWYLHGEMVAPPEAMIRRASRIFVPLAETAEAFVHGGVDRARLEITRICVEQDLLPRADARARARQSRYSGGEPLTVAFFSSGAEPPRHVEVLVAGALALGARRGFRALVFAARRGRLHRALRETPSVELVPFDDRADLDRRTAEHFPRFDLVVSPPHERSNWAAALGVPFLLVGPDIGPFAPRNREWLCDLGVAHEIAGVAEAQHLPSVINELRGSGRLLHMSQRGAHRARDGFAGAAAAVIREAERRGVSR